MGNIIEVPSGKKNGRSQKFYLLIPAAVLLILLIFFYGPGNAAPREESLQARRGVLDLREQVPGSDEIIPLAGEWEFYRSRFVLEADGTPAYVQLPHTWQDDRFGYATYRLRITGLEPDKEYGLKIPYQSTSFILLRDGKVIARNGIPGKTRQESLPEYQPSVVTFSPAADSTELVLQVSNFFHRRGGAFQPLLLGYKEAVQTADFWNCFLDGVMVMLFFLSGLYNLPLFFMKKEKNSLLLGLLFMEVGLLLMFETPDVLIMALFPRMKWMFFERTDYILTYTLPILTFLFIHSIYRRYTKKTLLLLLMPVVLILLFILITPPWIYTIPNRWFQYYSYFLYLLLGFHLFRAIRAGEIGARIIFADYLIFACSVISNNLFSASPWSRGNYLPLSFLKRLVPITSPVYSQILDVVSWLLVAVFIIISSFSLTFTYPERQRRLKEEREKAEELRLQEKARSYGFSQREWEVARLMLQGRNNNEIGEQLFLSLSTVKTYISRIFRKTGAVSRNELFFLFQEKSSQENSSG